MITIITAHSIRSEKLSTPLHFKRNVVYVPA